MTGSLSGIASVWTVLEKNISLSSRYSVVARNAVMASSPVFPVSPSTMGRGILAERKVPRFTRWVLGAVVQAQMPQGFLGAWFRVWRQAARGHQKLVMV